MSWGEPTSKDAFILSWASVVLTIIAVVVGIGYFIQSGSTLCLVFGLENCIDFLSSVIVLWRFYCPGEMTKEREDLLHKREKRASMAISFALVALGLEVMITSADDLAKGPESSYDMKIVMGIACFSIFVFGALTFVKFRFADKLQSASLYKDGLCSLIGTVLAMSLFVNTMIIRNNPSLWYLDPAVAMFLGFVSLVIGLHAVIIASCVQGLPIFHPHWWVVSRGDGMDEIEGRGLEAADFGDEEEVKPKEKPPKLSNVV